MPQNYKGFRTIDELINWTFNKSPEQVMKDAGGMSTGDLGAYNPVFGAMVWANFNLEANFWSIMPKFVWDFSGWRIFTSKGNSLVDAGTNNNTNLGGTVQGGLLAAPVKPLVEAVTTIPKTLQYPFQVSELDEYLIENSRDDLWGSLAQQRLYAADQVKEMWNQMLTKRVKTLTQAQSDLRRLDIESIDCVVSSKAEWTAASTAVNDLYNPWKDTASIDRKNYTKYDSTVVSPSGDLTTDDVITDHVIQDVLQQLRTAGGKEPTLMVGGQDTYTEVQSAYSNALRIINPTDIRREFNVTVNGIDTFTGAGVGLHISTIYGLPFIPTKDAPKASGDVGDLFILNTSADKNSPMKPMLGLQVLKPIVYYEASKRIQGYPFINGSFNDKALYEAMLELTCRNFAAQGKVINIKKGN